jgi:hypothetical protein
MRDNLTRTVYWYLFPLRVQTDAPGSLRRCSLAHVCSKQISPLQSCLRLMLRIILPGWENCDGILISSPVFERATIMCQLAEPILTSILSEKTSIFLLMVPLPPQTLGLQASQAGLTRPKEPRSRWGCRVWIWTRVSAFSDLLLTSAVSFWILPELMTRLLYFWINLVCGNFASYHSQWLHHFGSPWSQMQVVHAPSSSLRQRCQD